MTILFALLTSFTNALAVTLQHIASTSDTEKSSGWKFVKYLLGHPLWLLGGLALGGSLVFHALALHFGPLSLVQPILVTGLIVALVLRQLWLHQSIRGVTWVAAIVTGAGLVMFLVMTSPHGGLFLPASSAWTAPRSIASSRSTACTARGTDPRPRCSTSSPAFPGEVARPRPR